MSGREVGTVAGGRLPVGHYNGGELRRGSGIEQAKREREREESVHHVWTTLPYCLISGGSYYMQCGLLAEITISCTAVEMTRVVY